MTGAPSTRLERKSFDSPDQVRNPYEKGQVDVLKVGDTHTWDAKRVTIQPGWRFTTHSAEAFGTELCEVFHIKLFLQGRFAVRMRDETEMEFQAGEIGIIDPGHEAWVPGDEPCAFIDLAEVVRQAGGQP